MFVLIKQFNNFNIEIYGTYEDPLFKAKDIADLLEIKEINDLTSLLDDQCKVNNFETIYLTEDGLYEILFISKKSIAKEFKTWVKNIIKENRIKYKSELEFKLQQQHQLILEKDQELNLYKQKTYEEIQKTSHVYVIKTDNGYKVGKTKDIFNRVKGLQTGNVNDLEIILDHQTSNADLLERAVHYILDRYRCNSNREFFECELQYIKNVVTILGNVIDTLKSTYQHISNDELINQLHENVGIIITENHKISNSLTINKLQGECVNDVFFDWMQKNIVEKKNNILRLKNTCEYFLDKNNIHSKELSIYKKKIEKYIKDNYKNIKWKHSKIKIPINDDKKNAITCYGWKHIGIKNV